MIDQVPEVAEAAAVGIVASLYQDIREVTGAELVNLVYRHLATDPNALEWAWSALRPHFVSGALRSQADHLRAGVESSVSALHDFASVRLPPSAANALPVLNTYCKTNSLNMMALAHLLRIDQTNRSVSIAGGDTRAALVPEPAPSTARLDNLPESGSLPPLPHWEQIDPQTVACVKRLNAYAEDGTPAVVASLYRHLACWPDLLPPTEQLLQPLAQAGVLRSLRDATAADAARLVRRQPLPVPALPAVFEQRFKPFLSRLASVTIAKMIPIGCLLLEHCQAATAKPPGAVHRMCP